jgi:hypothetical protein
MVLEAQTAERGGVNILLAGSNDILDIVIESWGRASSSLA